MSKTSNRSTGASSSVTAAALWAVAVSLGLGMWLTASHDFSGVAAVILLVPCVGAFVAYSWPHRVLALVAGAVLIGAAMIVLLIGFTGLLYVPSIVLLVIAIFRGGSTSAAAAQGDR